MREIIFRGKRKDNGEWIYWNIYGELCRLSGKRTRLAISKTSCEHYYHYIYQIRQLIIPETVGQYTGLTDKNGKKIFEGDIVVSTNAKRLSNRPHIVRFSTISGYCYCEPDREPVVIGNIHDNPELLKGGKQE